MLKFLLKIISLDLISYQSISLFLITADLLKEYLSLLSQILIFPFCLKITLLKFLHQFSMKTAFVQVASDLPSQCRIQWSVLILHLT